MYMFGADDEGFDGDMEFSKSDVGLQQKNNERLLYVLSQERKHETFILLHNGLYFGKMARSDELLGYTENNMKNILTAFLCIINPANFTFADKMWEEFVCERQFSVLELTCLLDKCFGLGFAEIVRRPWSFILNQYEISWIYCSFKSKCIPKVLVTDIKRLRDFLCTSKTTRNEALLFVTTNNTDGKTLWQNSMKILK